MTKRLFNAAAALCALAVAHTTAIAQGPPPANVRLDAAREESLMIPRSVTGEIFSLRRTLLAAQAEGFVIELTPNAGDAVEEGEVIARLDDTIASLEVKRAEADLRASRGVVMEREASLARLRRDFERTKQLETRGSATTSALDAAETAVRTAEALLVQAEALVLADEARVALAERRLRDMTITAPFDGRVIRKETEVGAWLSAGDPVAEIVSLTELEARIDVPEHLVGYLSSDLGSIPMTIPGLGDMSDTTARVISVIPQGDSLSRMFPVRLAVEIGPITGDSKNGADGRVGLRPGMSVTAFVPTGSVEPVLTIHKDAVLRDDAGLFAFMAVPKSDAKNPRVTGQAVPARLSRLFASGDRVAIRPGQIRPGSWLLVEGNERVFPTQPLVVQDPPPGTPFAGGSRGAGGSSGDRSDAKSSEGAN
jgi:RND family efflux transporter MFP subunit